MHGALIGLAFALAGCAAPGPKKVVFGPPQAIPIVHTSVDRDRWYVVLDTDAAGRRLFFLDTGYSATTCDDDFAAELALETRGKVRVHGEAGTLTAGRARLPPIEMGGHRLFGMRCLVRDLDSTSSIRDPAETQVAGVLGADALRAFRVVIDPATATVHLRDPRTVDPLPRHAPDVVPLRREMRIGTRPLVPITVDGRRAWPVVDTGASGTHLDGVQLGLVPVEERKQVLVRASGGDGSVVRDLAFYEAEIALAGHTIGPLEITGRDPNPWNDGLLGLDVLGGFLQDYDFAHHRARFVPVAPASVPSLRKWEATPK